VWTLAADVPTIAPYGGAGAVLLYSLFYMWRAIGKQTEEMAEERRQMRKECDELRARDLSRIERLESQVAELQQRLEGRQP
jgi:hypothetical protein